MAKQSPIDTDFVRELALLVAETGLSEIEVEKGDLKIRVARTLTVSVTDFSHRGRSSARSPARFTVSVLA